MGWFSLLVRSHGEDRHCQNRPVAINPTVYDLDLLGAVIGRKLNLEPPLFCRFDLTECMVGAQIKISSQYKKRETGLAFFMLMKAED